VEMPVREAPSPGSDVPYYGLRPHQTSNLYDLSLDAYKGNRLSEILPTMAHKASFKHVTNGNYITVPNNPKCPKGWIPAIAVIPVEQNPGSPRTVVFSWSPISLSCGNVGCVQGSGSCADQCAEIVYYECCSSCNCDGEGNCESCCSTCSYCARWTCVVAGDCTNEGGTSCSTSTPSGSASSPDSGYIGAQATAEEILEDGEITSWKVILTGLFKRATVNTFCKLNE